MQKARLATRRGYLPAAAIIILAAITLAVAFVIYFNRDLILKTKKDQQAQQTTVTPSPKPSPASDETVYTDEGTANWKTYRNEEHGFEFNYPEKYFSHPSDSKDVLLLKSDKDAQTWDIRISWYVWNSGVKSINELTNLKNSALFKIGSEDALKLSTGKESKQVGYIFIHNGKEYDFEVNTVSLKIMDDIDQIISTFQFTD